MPGVSGIKRDSTCLVSCWTLATAQPRYRRYQRARRRRRDHHPARPYRPMRPAAHGRHQPAALLIGRPPRLHRPGAWPDVYRNPGGQKGEVRRAPAQVVRPSRGAHLSVPPLRSRPSRRSRKARPCRVACCRSLRPPSQGPRQVAYDLGFGRQPRRQVFILGGPGRGRPPVRQWMFVLREGNVVSAS
jgi:hypothetical protein